MSKDRAAPFSRKHRRYWIPVTGGMILIGLINVAIGFLSYEPAPTTYEKIEFQLDAGAGVGVDAGGDGGVDAGGDSSVDAPTPPR